MSRRHVLAHRIMALDEIASILSAMKSLALMEIHLLGEFMTSQRQLTAGIERAAADLLAWHPALRPPAEAAPELCVVIGSQQGFCGDTNDALLDYLAQRGIPALTGRWIVVGQRLSARLENDPRMLLALPGATVADEVPAVLQRLTREIVRLMASPDLAGRGLSALHHDPEDGAIRLRRLLPLRDLPAPRAAAFAPDLNLPPADVLRGLMQHYLHAILNEVLYGALLAENRQREMHMERALRRLDERRARLRLAANRQRQSDITEEIELLLLAGEMQAPAPN
ncbi:F0F1 ATP synthase subunit gamma [Sulfuricystis multivorans]|uniref:F0F1 ATP synthase subunit gamma n=1 Tax=Sulfuricystis multivorans TaxID=2211108 RepID=UPI000F83F9BA|nr:F0F1 ATP synthase subunit gamma [Sulfuricystis multivorans]